jgi:hypothetical protein
MVSDALRKVSIIEVLSYKGRSIISVVGEREKKKTTVFTCLHSYDNTCILFWLIFVCSLGDYVCLAASTRCAFVFVVNQEIGAVVFMYVVRTWRELRSYLVEKGIFVESY